METWEYQLTQDRRHGKVTGSMHETTNANLHPNNLKKHLAHQLQLVLVLVRFRETLELLETSRVLLLRTIFRPRPSWSLAFLCTEQSHSGT